MSTWPSPPRWLVWLSCALVLVGAGVCLLGALRIGVTVDETFHVVRLRNFLDHGWYLLDDDLGPGGRLGDWVGDAYVYAPFSTLLLHGANVLLGHESASSVAVTSEAYAVRHLGVALIGALGVVATAWIARLVSGSWRWGLVAAGMLSSLPMWWGHAMFNVKDTPVATGYTWVTLGCMLAMVSASEDRSASRDRIAGAAFLAGGLLLTIGTRPAMWVAVVPTLAIAALVIVARPAAEGTRRSVPLLVLLVSVVVPLVLLAAIYPHVFLRPDLWLLGSVSDSSSNQMVSSRGHLPFAIATTVPIVLLVVALLGAFGRLSAWRARPRLLTGTAPYMLLLLAQALMLPALLVVSSAPVSGGLRHVLFAAPAVAVLMAAGLAQLSCDFGVRGRQVLAGLVGVGMVLPAVTQVQLFPYSYGYVNELAEVADLDSPGDFWQASFREYADGLGTDDFVVCGVDLDADGRPSRRMPNGGQSWLALSQECSAQELGVLAPYAPSRSAESEVRGEFVSLRVHLEPPSQGCREVARVTRARLLSTVVLSTAEICPLVLLPYEGPVRFDGAGRGAGRLLGGWTGSGGDPFITVEDRAHVGFALEGADDRVRLRVAGEASGDVEFRLNNEPAMARASESGWQVVPIGPLTDVGDPDNLVLTVIATGGEAHVSGVEVTGGGS